MTSSSLPANPFVAAGMIEDPRLFVGRKDELHAIAIRMTGAQPTSINIVGDKRIGKSSLLYYFYLTWQQRVQNPNRYLVIYRSLRNANCQTEAGFYQEVANGWGNHASNRRFSLNNPWKPKSWNRQTFSDAIREWEKQQVLPVLCLDDFESLFDYPQEFNDGFYDNLRSLMEDNALMLVVASRKPLKVYGEEHRFVSSFFNIAHCIVLRELTTDEAMELTRLPSRSIQGAASATTIKGFAENLAQQIIDSARRLPRRLNLPYPDSKKLTEDPFPALQTWLAEIERSHSSKRFLLCLDEFERLSEVVNATNSRAPLNFIRHLLQHQKQWILLFSGSHQLSELDAYWSDYLINTRALRMTYLQESEARDLILQPIEDFTNIYEPEAVNKIIQTTRCQPYLVQLVCYELVELLNRDIRANRRQPNTAKATLADVQEIIPIALERGDQYFRELWTSLEESDRHLLRRLIAGETPTLQDSKLVKKLARKEILTPEGNAFQVPLVQKYIEQLLEEE